MKTLRRVFLYVGSSILLLSLLLELIGGIVETAKGMSAIGIQIEQYTKMGQAGAETVSKLKGALTIPIISIILMILGIAVVMFLLIFFLIKFSSRRRRLNEKGEFRLITLPLMIHIGYLVIIQILALIQTGVVAKIFGREAKPDALTIVFVVFGAIALAGYIVAECMARPMFRIANYIAGGAAGVMFVNEIMLICQDGAGALTIVAGVFGIIAYAIISAVYFLPNQIAPATRQRVSNAFNDLYEDVPEEPRAAYAEPRPAPAEPRPAPAEPRPAPAEPRPAPAPAPKPAPAPAVATAANGVDVEKELRKLKSLLESGVLTQEEYDAKRKKYIDML